MKQWVWTLLLVMLPAIADAQMGVPNPTTPTSTHHLEHCPIH
jgi:hypothetical protein